MEEGAEGLWERKNEEAYKDSYLRCRVSQVLVRCALQLATQVTLSVFDIETTSHNALGSRS